MRFFFMLRILFIVSNLNENMVNSFIRFSLFIILTQKLLKGQLLNKAKEITEFEAYFKYNKNLKEYKQLKLTPKHLKNIRALY